MDDKKIVVSDSTKKVFKCDEPFKSYNNTLFYRTKSFFSDWVAVLQEVKTTNQGSRIVQIGVPKNNIDKS